MDLENSAASPPPPPPRKTRPLIYGGFIIDLGQFDHGESICLKNLGSQMLASASKIKNKIYGTSGSSDLASKNFLFLNLSFTIFLSQFLCEDHFFLKNLVSQMFRNASKIENKTKK